MRSAYRRAIPFGPAAGTAAIALAACGGEGITVPEDDPAHAGAVLFAERCSGCSTMTPAGAQGSAERELRVQGPNFDERKVTSDDALYAIQNGGFSGAIMPQNIVVGDDATSVAEFVAAYSGSDVEEPLVPDEAAAPTVVEDEEEAADVASEQSDSGQPEDE
ncbi:MAG: hypothetical protein ACR2OC_06460 [Solirubrobacterales bacterium]